MLFLSRRPLLQALAISLLIHAVLLFGVLTTLPPHLAAPAAPLSAELRRPEDKAPAAAARAAASTGPAATSARASTPAPSRAAAAPAVPAVVPAPATAPVVAATSPAPAVAAATPPVEAGTATRRGGGEAVAAGAASSSASASSASAANSGLVAGGDGVSADDVRQYRFSVASAARRFKRYPPQARERGWEGTADVGLELRARAAAPQVSLLQSSGRPLIDAQALETIRQAARATTLPDGLRGRDFSVRFSIVFNLEDAE